MKDDLWTFSLAFYDRPGVPAACLQVQDGHGADVDMILFALWCAGRGCRIAAAEMAATDEMVASWRDTVVRPIRQVRRALKPAPDGFDPASVRELRDRLLSDELAAERLQQDLMAAHAPPAGGEPRGSAAQANLACYAAHLGIDPAIPAFTTLLDAFRDAAGASP